MPQGNLPKMYLGGWLTKNDILKDLKRATGKRNFDFKDDVILVGEQAPAHRCNDFDDEMELQMLRLSGGGKTTIDTNTLTPDLAGITQMLRMVEQQEEPEKPELREPNTNSNNNCVLTISKLNPNVNEFVPKSYVNDVKGLVTETSNDKVEILKTEEVLEVDKIEICNTVHNGPLHTKQLTDTEIVDMRDRLKKKISDTSKAISVKLKRERNLAMASLVMLYCQKPTEAYENKPNLITPEYFEKSLQNCPKAECSSSGSLEKINMEKNSFKLEMVEQSIENGTSSRDKIESAENISENTGECKDIKTKELVRARTEEIAKEANTAVEVKKTQPTNQKKSILCLSDIKYTSKAGSSKPASPVTAGTNKEENVQNVSPYKPSAYAAQLSEKYEMRQKLLEACKSEFWDMVDNKLKQREEEMNEKQAQERQLDDVKNSSETEHLQAS